MCPVHLMWVLLTPFCVKTDCSHPHALISEHMSFLALSATYQGVNRDYFQDLPLGINWGILLQYPLQVCVCVFVCVCMCVYTYVYLHASFITGSPCYLCDSKSIPKIVNTTQQSWGHLSASGNFSLIWK